ncbi:MAG: prepilin-type N-terminal cleavage/methylation domain-containing protein [candidate division Zixibacteria bacterium]|nr:prepilin-type N-terminal cleavage/methylation domain-containing protein [candidate division Zixibacteria bacterium]
MKKFSFNNQAGFSLIELTIALIIISILIGVALQQMTSVMDDGRQIKTEREMEILANSIVGNPGLTGNSGRTDFGYVGDVGSFPPNISALYTNPGGYASWDGPYIPVGFVQDSTGLKTDEWGAAYNYSGGVTISSTGSGTTISKQIARAASDYLLNTVYGDIKDNSNFPPGSTYQDSVDIVITIPNGAGGSQTKLYHPDSVGNFTLDSLPVGRHPLRIIYTPNVDTIFRYLTVYPRHKDIKSFRFFGSYFSGGGGGGGGGGGCDSSGVLILRPNGSGSITSLSTAGCGSNWQCISEVTSDEDATRLERASNSYATDVYAMEDIPFTDCDILRVTVSYRARKEKNTGAAMPVIYVAGVEYQGTESSLTNSYSNYSYQWNSNPGSGSAWTWSDIVNLEAGLALKGQNASFPAYVTQVWLEIEY